MSAATEQTVLEQFVAALKAKLRENDAHRIVDVSFGQGSTQTGAYLDDVEVDWHELDRQIDELAAEFAARLA